jgi:hypothetical protein
MDHRLPLLSRREVLAGGAGVLFLAACGGGDDDGSGSTTATSGAAGAFSLVQFFGQDVLVPGTAQRAPFGLGDADGVITAGGPESLLFQVRSGGEAIGDPITADRHAEGLPRPYYPLVFTPPEPGTYDVTADIDGQAVTAAFSVVAPDTVAVPQLGDPMRSLATPTVADHHGVDPICTADPQCPLHDVSLDAALTEGRPIALLISTPKFCQVAICGPVLDLLVAQQAAFGDQVRLLHAEVYTDDTAQTTTDAVNTYGLTFEPCLFLARADGTIDQRLDNIFDEVELQAALTRLV